MSKSADTHRKADLAAIKGPITLAQERRGDHAAVAAAQIGAG